MTEQVAAYEVRNRGVVHFLHKNDPCTKTGSGQTEGKLKKTRFLQESMRQLVQKVLPMGGFWW